MVSLLYLKHAFNESDEYVSGRWGETPTWQYFSGSDYFEHRWPCDLTLLGSFRKLLGEEGVEELLASTMEVAGTLKLIAKKGLVRVIFDTTGQEMALAHPTDSKLLETARTRDTPRQNCYPLNRIQSKGVSMEWTWLDTDKHLKTERWLGCCRPRAPRLARFRYKWVLLQRPLSAGAVMPCPSPLASGRGQRPRGLMPC